MTNQPDESHPMRDRVDKAISWFTETDEPDAVDETDARAADRPGTEPAAAGATGDYRERPTDESVAPADERGAETSRDVTRSDERAPEAADAASRPEDRIPEPDEALARQDERRSEADSGRADVRTPLAQESSAASEGRAPYEERTADVRREEPVSGADEAARTEAGSHHGATAAVAGGALAAGAVAAHERRTENEREAEQAASERGTDTAAPATADEDTHIRRHEQPGSWAEVHPNSRAVPPEGAIDSEAETTASQRSLYRDEAPTVAMPAAAGAAAGAAAASSHGEQTAVMDATEYARLRREERAARDRQLGKVIAAPDDADQPVPTRYTTPSTYRALPSLGLLLFRLVIAAVLGIRAWQHITHLSATRATWAATIVPSPGTVAYAQIGLEIVIAVMLVLGLGTRIAGLLLLVLSVVSLVFVQWGAVNPFQPGANDFIGVVDVLLAGAGLLFATVGPGRAAFDGAIHSGRIQRKNDKLFA